MKHGAPEDAGLLSPPAPANGREEGWRARLDLAFEARAGRTVLAESRHNGPLLVQRPLYPEDPLPGAAQATPCHVYVLHPPGGVVAGDELQIGAAARAGAHALLTTPAAGKFYRSGAGASAHVRQELAADAGALEWLPQENIFFPGARAELATLLQLSAGARCFAWDIACFGLPAQERLFASGAVRLRLEVRIDAEFLLAENQLVDAQAFEARWGLDGNAALGAWVAYPAGEAELELARTVRLPDVTLAASLVGKLLVGRAMARRADRLREAFVETWRALRPPLFGRTASRPRIWAT
jgi:urease accessory protein